MSFGCAVVISSHLLLFIFIVHTQSKDVFVIFVVLCVRLYSYCISFGTVFMFACTSDMCIKLLLTENLSWYSVLNAYHKVTIAIKCRLIHNSLYQNLLIFNQDCWSYLKM